MQRCKLEPISGECGFTSSGGQPGVPEGPSDAFEACAATTSSTMGSEDTTTSGGDIIKVQSMLIGMMSVSFVAMFI